MALNKKFSFTKKGGTRFSLKESYVNKWKHFYNSHWNSYREKFLKENWKCYVCGDLATDVDHIEPHRGDTALFMRPTNHLPLCHKCHSYVTGAFDRPGKEGKLEWISMMKNNEIRVKVIGFDWSYWFREVSFSSPSSLEE